MLRLRFIWELSVYEGFIQEHAFYQPLSTAGDISAHTWRFHTYIARNDA